MSGKDDVVFIEHMLDSIRAIEEFSKNLSKEELSSNRLIQSAIVREIEIIGEAAKNVSQVSRKEYPEVEWKVIVGA